MNPAVNRLNLDEESACLGPYDITLVAKEGKQFQVHRNVLLQASPFFEKLLSSDMKESNERVIRLPTITHPQMADILQFIYNGSVQITSQENAEKLIETADFLLLTNLKTIAGKYLEQHMTAETCISMNYLAERYSCEELVASTRKFINSNFITVTASEEFLNLPSNEVEKWISSDEIVIDAEENVFETVLRWIDHDKSERSGKFSELFSHVRLTCVSRDYLLSHVVLNDLMKENADCLDSVTGALEWFDRPTDCDVPRPHPPRKALTINVIVIADCIRDLQPCIYLPATDEWYILPATNRQLRLGGICATISCGGKLFYIARAAREGARSDRVMAAALTSNNETGSECYDPDSNQWSPVSWANNLSFRADEPLVVKNNICFFIKGDFRSTDLWIYSLDSDSWTPLANWIDRAFFCAVAVDSYIYVLGGNLWSSGEVLSECARFDTVKNQWQKIAPLNEARRNAFGAFKNEKIFIAGGENSDFLRTCEVYNLLTDEWQFIASLRLGRTWGSMVLADETFYVVGGFMRNLENSLEVECYNHESDEWNVKATVPVNRAMHDTKFMPYPFKGCSLRVFKGVLTNLKSIAESN